MTQERNFKVPSGIDVTANINVGGNVNTVGLLVSGTADFSGATVIGISGNGGNITGTAIENSPIGQSQPTVGSFTDLNALNGLSIGPGTTPVIYESRVTVELTDVPLIIQTIGLKIDNMIIWYVRHPSGTALEDATGSKWAPAGPTATFQHWGATTTTDNCANQIKLALEWGMPIVNRRFDEFQVKSSIGVTNDAEVDWQGGRIVYDRDTLGPGLHFSQQTSIYSKRHTIRIRDVDIFTKNAMTSRGIWVRYNPAPANGNDVYRHYPSVEFNNIMVAPYDTNDDTMYFTNANFEFEDRIGCYLTDCTANGPKRPGERGWYAPSTIGFHFLGESTYTRTVMIGCHARTLEVGIACYGEYEGVEITNCQVVNCLDGIHIIPGTIGYATVGVFFTSVHVNAQRYCLKIDSGAEIFIMNAELYRFDDFYDWAGIAVGLDGGAVRDIKIHHCSFSGQAATTHTTDCIILEDASRVIINDNFGVQVQTMVNTDNVVGAAPQIFIKDNWFSDQTTPTAVNRTSLIDQCTDPSKVFTAWSY